MPKKPVLRSCVVCRAKREKKDLIRIVRSPDGEVVIDYHGKAPGRGAYLCKDLNCLNTAKKTHKLDNALEVEIPEHIYSTLLENINE